MLCSQEALDHLENQHLEALCQEVKVQLDLGQEQEELKVVCEINQTQDKDKGL